MPTMLRALALLSALAVTEAYTAQDLGRLLDYTPDYTALKVAGIQHTYNAPASTCEALSGVGQAKANMTKWCKKNCGFDPPNCPATLCMCGDAGEKASAKKENLGGQSGCSKAHGAEGVDDKWCVTNCEASMLNCPAELCDCPNRAAATKHDLDIAAPTSVAAPVAPVPVAVAPVAPTPMAIPEIPPTVIAQPVNPQESAEAAAEAVAKIASDAASVAAEAADKEAADAEAAATAQQKRDDENEKVAGLALTLVLILTPTPALPPSLTN